MTIASLLLPTGIDLIERGFVPDAIVRQSIRRLCAARQREVRTPEDIASDRRFANWMRTRPIAEVPEQANSQHYEVPADFFAAWLGPRRKYSCCYWGEGVATLAEAEVAALTATCQRAELADGQSILELGCGWGSLTLWLAEQYPHSQITAVSNSASQRQYIEGVARQKGFERLRVVTADVNHFETDQQFDRVVSVEMFEHLQNYQEMLARIARWLTPEGKLFIHIFCHQRRAYAFESKGPADWMGRHFFAGGIMPSFDLLREFSQHLHVARTWQWSGEHYQKTAEAWLANYDRQRDQVLAALTDTYCTEGPRQFHRWRMFLMAVAEMFGLHGGQEWFVGHYLLERAAASPGPARA